MNPSTHSASLKKTDLFSESLVEFHVLFYLFSSLSFILWNYSFHIAPVVSYKIWSWLYMSSYVLTLCLGFILIMMIVCCGRAGLSEHCGELVHMQLVGEERNAYKCLFLCLVQYGTQGKCPSFAVRVSL
jgi:hypothetical protein